jgi:2,3-bisphosphoglycerate-independent phosphoglycerate mutase
VEHDDPPPPRPRPKRVLIVLAGAFDPPGERTPLCEAEKPALDRLARVGRCGVASSAARSPWEGFTALLGLEAGVLALGPAEALGLGVEVAADECVCRADFVTLGDRGLSDPFGGKVKDPEASLLLDAARASAPMARFVRAGGHRNLAIVRGAPQFCLSPWEMVGRRPTDGLAADGPVREVHDAVHRALAGHDVNAVRIDLGENPANALWLHGGGRPAAPRAGERAPAGGAILVGRGPATTGLALHLGWQSSVVEGDDDVLAAADLVVVRTESVLDAAAVGGPEAKRDALSRADARLVAPLLAAVEERDAFVMAVATDCVVDAVSRALVPRPVPFVLAGRGRAGGGAMTESACESGGLHLASGAEFFAELAGLGEATAAQVH